METVAVVRSKYCGKSELNIPGVIDHGHNICQGQLPLLLADGGECWPGEVTHEAPEVNRLRVSQIRISDKEVVDNLTKIKKNFQPLICLFTAFGL